MAPPEDLIPAAAQPSSGPRKQCYCVEKKSEWLGPVCSSQIVVIGDSNLDRITQVGRMMSHLFITVVLLLSSSLSINAFDILGHMRPLVCPSGSLIEINSVNVTDQEYVLAHKDDDSFYTVPLPDCRGAFDYVKNMCDKKRICNNISKHGGCLIIIRYTCHDEDTGSVVINDDNDIAENGSFPVSEIPSLDEDVQNDTVMIVGVIVIAITLCVILGIIIFIRAKSAKKAIYAVEKQNTANFPQQVGTDVIDGWVSVEVTGAYHETPPSDITADNGKRT